MDALWIMLRNVIVFVLLAIPGYILVKAKIVKSKESAILSKLLTYVGMPFLILSSTLNVKFTGEFAKSIIFVFILGTVFTVVAFLLSALLVKKGNDAKKRGMARFCMVFSNNGFLGIPLAKAVFGNAPCVVYVIVLNILTNVLMFTLGVYLISGDKKSISVKKAVLNPVLIAFALGLGLNFLNVTDYIPEVSSYSNYLSNIVTPLSMVILGIKMAEINLVSTFARWKVYYVSAIKLLALPTLAVSLTFLLKTIFNVSGDIIIGVFLAFAMPTAGLSSTFSDRYNGDTENAVYNTLGSTILSVLTIPTLYYLLCLII